MLTLFKIGSLLDGRQGKRKGCKSQQVRLFGEQPSFSECRAGGGLLRVNGDVVTARAAGRAPF